MVPSFCRSGGEAASLSRLRPCAVLRLNLTIELYAAAPRHLASPGSKIKFFIVYTKIYVQSHVSILGHAFRVDMWMKVAYKWAGRNYEIKQNIYITQ